MTSGLASDRTGLREGSNRFAQPRSVNTVADSARRRQFAGGGVKTSMAVNIVLLVRNSVRRGGVADGGAVDD